MATKAELQLRLDQAQAALSSLNAENRRLRELSDLNDRWLDLAEAIATRSTYRYAGS